MKIPSNVVFIFLFFPLGHFLKLSACPLFSFSPAPDKWYPGESWSQSFRRGWAADRINIASAQFSKRPSRLLSWITSPVMQKVHTKSNQVSWFCKQTHQPTNIRDCAQLGSPSLLSSVPWCSVEQCWMELGASGWPRCSGITADSKSSGAQSTSSLCHYSTKQPHWFQQGHTYFLPVRCPSEPCWSLIPSAMLTLHVHVGFFEEPIIYLFLLKYWKCLV